jgi:hypothetical protein
VTTVTTTSDVATWMLGELERRRYLEQEQVAWDIQRKFGKQFTYHNENGNPAIDKKVLTAFRKLSGDGVIWSRSERHWRYRVHTDKPGRQQDD